MVMTRKKYSFKQTVCGRVKLIIRRPPRSSDQWCNKPIQEQEQERNKAYDRQQLTADSLEQARIEYCDVNELEGGQPSS